jgi:hypothetical protein
VRLFLANCSFEGFPGYGLVVVQKAYISEAFRALIAKTRLLKSHSLLYIPQLGYVNSTWFTHQVSK